MVGRWPLRGWPEGYVPIVSDVTAALGLDPLVMLLRSTAALALSRLGGRESTLVAGAVRVRLTLEELTVEADPQGALGRLGEVRVVARDVVWAATRLQRVTLSGRDVHVRPDLLSAAVVAAPVLIDADGLVTVHPARSSRLAVELEPRCTDDGQAVAARALRIGARRIPLPAWTPLRRPVPTDRLPPGMRVVDVETADGVVRISAELDRWSAPVRPPPSPSSRPG